MAILFPPMDALVGGLILLGSPGIGYVILRCVIISSQSWEGWKRLAGASAVGAGWTGSTFYVFMPLIQTDAPISMIIENAAYAGMGLFLLTALASLTNRIVITRALAQYFPRGNAKTNVTYAHYEPAVPYGRAYSEMTYKPSQLRAPVSRTEKKLAEPTFEKEEDVLALLKEENFDSAKRKTKKTVSDEDENDLESGALEDETNAQRARKRAPMDDLGELAGFEETLAQLQRDLKDFNENVAGHGKHRSKHA